MFFAVLALVCIALSGLDSCRATECDYHLVEKVFQMQLKLEAIEKQTQNADEIAHEIQLLKRDVQELKKTDTIKTPVVAFSVYGSSSVYAIEGQIVVFQHVHMNEGDGYNTSTGIFKAPFSGVYQFTAHLCNIGGHHVAYAIVHNEKEVAISSKGNTPSEGCNSVSALLRMKVGDDATVRGTYADNQIRENRWRRASFIGVLIHI